MKYAPIIAAALLLGACETIPAAAPPPPAGASFEGELDLGEWRTSSEAATLAAFQQNVSARYGAGLALTDALADLRRSSFNCGPAPSPDLGDPPAQVCRRTTTANSCTHTWQVHLFDADGSLARTRGLYDRRCGGDGLLGGPG